MPPMPQWTLTFFQLQLTDRFIPTEIAVVGNRLEDNLPVNNFSKTVFRESDVDFHSAPSSSGTRRNWLWLQPERFTVIMEVFFILLSPQITILSCLFLITNVTKITPSFYHVIHAMWLPSSFSEITSNLTAIPKPSSYFSLFNFSVACDSFDLPSWN